MNVGRIKFADGAAITKKRSLLAKEIDICKSFLTTQKNFAFCSFSATSYDWWSGNAFYFKNSILWSFNYNI